VDTLSDEFSRLLSRQTQIVRIAALLVLVLIGAVGVLAFMLVAGLTFEDLWVLRNGFLRILVPGFLLVVTLYLLDQHRRLRSGRAGPPTRRRRLLRHRRAGQDTQQPRFRRVPVATIGTRLLR
jgi:hypothetical protein